MTPFIIIAGICLGIIVGSIVEYIAHRFMHKRFAKVKLFLEIFDNHMRHHREFNRPEDVIHSPERAESYHPAKVTYLVVAAASPIFYAGYLFLPLLMAHGFTAALIAYTFAHDLTHWFLHNRRGKGRYYDYIIGLHEVHHHRFSLKNFNIVMPLGDMIFGTYEPPMPPSRRS